MASPLILSLRSPASAVAAGRRSFTAGPARRQFHQSWARLGAHGHAPPPEGDEDHGRSAYGFQSHHRHEHFTYPGEEQAPYLHAKARAEDPWADWKSPGVRTFILVSIGLYAYVQMLPSRESMKRSHTPSAARPSFDTVAKQGEDDPRPYLIRVFDYWIPGHEERQRNKIDEWAKEVDEAKQSHIFKVAVPAKIVRKGDYFEPYHKENAAPGQLSNYKDLKPRTEVDDELDLGIDRKKWLSQDKQV